MKNNLERRINEIMGNTIEEQVRNKGDLCIGFYKAKTNILVYDSQIKCINCGGYQTERDCYRASKNYYVNLNHGRPAIVFR